MVSTRNHPTPLPPPDLSPSKSSTTSTPRKTRATSKRSSTTPSFIHTPTPLTLLWLLISVPLVAWDTGYIMLRPHSMPGGKFHWPLWVPYKLYGTIDHVYGWPAFNAKLGFTAAQGALNIVESLGYIVYLCIAYKKGAGKQYKLEGRNAAIAIIIAFSAAVMTLSKTVLYWFNEHFSGYHSIGHNDVNSLIFLWIIPNGAWIVLPTYMIYRFGGEIIDGLSGETTTHANGEVSLKDE